jgi:NitT/TauT family transport system substrate-binding protein
MERKTRRPLRLHGPFRRSLISSIAVIAAVTLAACGNSASGTKGASGSGLESSTIRIGLPLATSTLAPVYLATEKGYWSKLGLNVKLVTFSGGTAASSALVGGSVDLVVGGATAVITADIQSNSSQLQEIFGGFNVPDYFFFAQKSITTVAQTKGKVWHITALNTDQGALAVQLLQQNGMSKSDVKIQEGGGTTVGLAGLAKGAVQVAVAAVPDNFKAAALGYNQIADTQQVYQNGAPLHAVYGKAQYINSHPNTVTAFLKGLSQGMLDLKSDPQAAAAADEKYAKTDPQYTLQGINYMAPYMFPDGQLPDDATMTKWMDSNVKVGIFTKALPQSVWLNRKWIDSYNQWKPS